MIGFNAHQRFATLSSQRPREKGKHRCRAWARTGAPPERNSGRRRMVNVDSVAIPIARSLGMLILGNTQRPRR